MPAESVAFTYDGATTATATITGVTLGRDYAFICGDPASTPLHLTADADPFVITVSDIAVANPGDTFYGEAQSDAPFFHVIGATIFEDGTSGEYPFAATWTFDGDKTVTCTFASTLGVDYELTIFDSAGSGSDSDTGTGGALVLTAVSSNTCADDYFWVVLQVLGELSFADRVFTAGLAGEGFLGNPQEATVFAVPPLFQVAFDDPTLEADPTWTQIG